VPSIITAAYSSMLYDQEFHNLQSSPKIILVIKSGRMRKAGPEHTWGDMRNVHKILVAKA
jgi:hypothetical protein